MSLFLIKSILSVAVVLSVLVALFTMLEVFGRAEKRYNVEKLKRAHRWNGRIYIALFAVIAYLCLSYLYRTKAELSARANFHSVFAISMAALLFAKVLFVRYYKLFYNQAKTVGLLIAFLSAGLIGTSAGYYLLVTGLGTKVIYRVAPAPADKAAIRADQASIDKGRELYESKCYLCHDPESNKTIVGPGHKDILKNPLLPASKRPATPENIAAQLRKPVDKMPPFAYLSDDEVESLIAYLNTL